MTTTCTASRLEHNVHRAGLTLALHLLPGVAFTAVAVVLARGASRAGLPPVFGMHAAVVGVLVPVQLGLIALAARRLTGSWRLSGALRYTERLPARRLAVLATITLAWAAAVFVLTDPVAVPVRAGMFGWWPLELDYTEHLTQADRYARSMLVTAWVAGLVLTSLVAPVVEELYFRGFLLPRLEHLGRWAPVVNTTLFALYHLWSPWQAPTRIVATMPLFYATWRTRAITLAIVVHVALNLVGDTVASIPIVFG